MFREFKHNVGGDLTFHKHIGNNFFFNFKIGFESMVCLVEVKTPLMLCLLEMNVLKTY